MRGWFLLVTNKWILRLPFILRMDTQRNVTLDLLRLFFAFGVVAIHLAPNQANAEWLGASFNVFCVPFFIVLGLFYFDLKHSHSDAVNTPKLRDFHLHRLLLPYLFWTLAYLAMRGAKHVLQGEQLHVDPIGAVFYGGSAVHMYFIPFLLTCQALILGLRQIVNRQYGLGFTLIVVSFSFSYLGAVRHYFGFDHAVEMSCFYVMAALLLRKAQHPSRSLFNGILGALIAGILLFLLSSKSELLNSIYVKPWAGYAAASFAMVLPALRSPSKTLLTFSSCSYGIYLMHHAWIEVIEFAAQKSGWPLPPYSLAEKVITALLISLACVMSIGIMRLNPMVRRLALGEGSPPKRKP